MRIFETKEFARFARKVGLTTERLLEAAIEVAAGNFDADLGAGVFKQRVAREGGGTSGGFRTILALTVGGHGFFVHGFAKRDKANVSPNELKALKRLAEVLAALDAGALEKAIRAGELVELKARSSDDESPA